MTTASAPGKIILFGEHAVVYGRPALAVPVAQVQATVEVSDAPGRQVWIEARDVGLATDLDELPEAHPLAVAVKSTYQAVIPLSNTPRTPGEIARGVRIHISSTVPIASGLGSGAAVSVALARALSTHLGHPLSDNEVNRIAYEAEKLHHGTSSGIDNTVVTYARPVYFVKGQPISTLNVGQPFTLVIGDTGVPAPTREPVGDVRRLWEADPAHWSEIFDEVRDIVAQARSAIEQGNIKRIGELMNANHALLQAMTVSSTQLDRLVATAQGAGALGAKLSGGGRGGNMIALVERGQASQVSAALRAAGGVRTIITEIRN
jgi:mevalonate kinase